MKIQEISIKNFRGVSTETKIKLNDFNTIVGQNDAGKSTILKALNLFLNDASFNKEDYNNQKNDPEVEIELVFSYDNEKVIIDEAIETTFKIEELVNENLNLVIRKKWDLSKETKQISSETYLVRKKYSQNDFILSSEKDLISMCKSLSIDTKKGNNEEYNNQEKREKIRNHNINNNISFTYEYEKLPTSGTARAKKISDALKKLLPRFEYFKADTSLEETDTSIQNFFKEIAEKTINEKVDKLLVESPVSTELENILKKISDKINSVVTDNDKIEPVIKFDWSKLVQTSFKSINSEGDIPLKSRGDGFRRITMMAYFEYLAEQDKSEKQNIIFGFEEPETFLHPSAQERLFSKLYSLCQNDYQVILTTHSPILVANSKISDIIHVYKEKQNYFVEQNISDVKKIADNIGITVDNQFIDLFDKAKLLFLVEGIDDALAFEHISKCYKNKKEVKKTFQELSVAIIPIGGCGSIKHWKALNLLSTFNKPFFIFLDSDKPNSSSISENHTNLLKYGFQEGIDFLISKKRSLENYIPVSFLNQKVPQANISYSDWDNVKDLCAKNPFANKLGGRGVAEKFFLDLDYNLLKTAFANGTSDEFLEVYNIILKKLQP